MPLFNRRGVAQVIRRILDARGSYIVEYGEKLQPVIEGRALRYWEDWDEGIYRWRVFITRTPSAGQRAAWTTTGFGNLGLQVPPIGSWWSVESVRNCQDPTVAANKLQLYIGGNVNAGVNVPASFLDAHFGTPTSPMLVSIVGDFVIGTAVQVGEIPKGDQQLRQVEYVGLGITELNGGVNAFSIAADVVDSAIRAEITGRFYLAER